MLVNLGRPILCLFVLTIIWMSEFGFDTLGSESGLVLGRLSVRLSANFSGSNKAQTVTIIPTHLALDPHVTARLDGY